MPFQSKVQQRYMYLKHPKIAKRWATETENESALPEKKKPKTWATMAKKENG